MMWHLNIKYISLYSLLLERINVLHSSAITSQCSMRHYVFLQSFSYLITLLVQLRGRVGRSNKEAHAHLFYPNKLLLSPEAKVTGLPLLSFDLFFCYNIDFFNVIKKFKLYNKKN